MSRASSRMGARPGRSVLRGVVSLGILAGLLWLLDGRSLAARLLSIEPGWILAVLAVTLAQVGLLGWRWRFTLGRLGVALPVRAAMAEYYRSLFLNQALPGGVLGDVSRAWRHMRATPGGEGVVVRAVVLERLSGQAVMTVWAGICLLILWGMSGGAASGGDPSGRTALLALGFAVLGVAAGLAWLGWRRTEHPRRGEPDGLAGRTRRYLRRALLDGPAFAVHLVTGILLVASYVLVFGLAARAVGAQVTFGSALVLAAPVLMSMLLPVSWAGWGVREATAAGLWALVGLPADEGVLVSAAYGVLVLAASLPGGVVLLRSFRQASAETAPVRDRRARPRPE